MALFAAYAPDNFVPSRERDLAVLVFIACGLSVLALAVLAGLLRGRRLCSGSPACPRRPALGRPLCGGQGRGEEEGAFEASLREELGRRRLARARRIVPWAQVLVVSMACTFTANSGLIGGSGKRFGSTVQDIAIGITAVIVIIMWISQWMGVSVVTLRSLDYWYSAFMACLVAYMSPFAIRADLVAYRMNVSIWFVFLCLFNLKPWFNFIWLLMISSTFCCTLLFGDRAESMKVADYNSQSALADWLQNFCAVVLVLLFLNQLLTYIARLELDTKFSRNELAAATSVLTSVCEVVVDLDDKFRLQRHSRELTDMLFLNPQRRLCQEDIRSFLASESDRRKFSRQMGQMVLPDSPEDGPHPSNTFQVSMKDSTGNSVNVNVIAVCYTGRDGVHAFMVGIVEVCDSMPLPSLGSTLETRRQRQRRPRQDSAGPQAAPPAAPLGPPEEAEEAESSGSGSGSDPSALGLEQAEGEHLAVWINMASAGYEMLHFTPNFHHVFGPCGLGEDFLPWVKRNQSEQFVSWIQTSWLSLSEGDVSIEIFPRSLLFLPTQLRQHRLAFLATVFLDQASCPAETEPSRTTVRLTFSNVRRVTAGAGGRRSRRRSRTPGVAADGQDGHFHLSI